MPASLYTHVMEIPSGATGRLRKIGTRKPRHEVGKDCRCGQEGCTNGQA